MFTLERAGSGAANVECPGGLGDFSGDEASTDGYCSLVQMLFVGVGSGNQEGDIPSITHRSTSDSWIWMVDATVA